MMSDNLELSQKNYPVSIRLDFFLSFLSKLFLSKLNNRNDPLKDLLMY